MPDPCRNADDLGQSRIFKQFEAFFQWQQQQGRQINESASTLDCAITKKANADVDGDVTATQDSESRLDCEETSAVIEWLTAPKILQACMPSPQRIKMALKDHNLESV